MAEEPVAKSVLPTPDDLVKGGVKVLPATLGSALLTAFSIFQWVSIPTSLISQLQQLRSVAEFWRSAYAQLTGMRPALDALVEIVRPFLSVWRAFSEPLKVWVSNLLPSLPMPQFAVDVLLMIAVCVPSVVRLHWLKGRIAGRTKFTRIKVTQLYFAAGQEVNRWNWSTSYPVLRDHLNQALGKRAASALAKHLNYVTNEFMENAVRERHPLQDRDLWVLKLRDLTRDAEQTQKLVDTLRKSRLLIYFAIVAAMLGATFVTLDLLVYGPVL